MKKILAFILCMLLICAMPIIASAKDYEIGDVFDGEVPGDNSTPVEESPTEGEISSPETTPEVTPEETPEEVPEETPPVETPPVETPPAETEPDWEEVNETVSDKIVNWILPHIEEISVVITLLLSIVYNVRRNKALDKSVIKLNNNAVTIAENNSSAISSVLSNIQGVSGAVTGYQTEIALLLEQFRHTAEDKRKLEAELTEIKKYLQLSKDANVEFANELAELLALANIPNFKKEEIGARHLAAVKAIADAEAKTETEEVKEDVGEKA